MEAESRGGPERAAVNLDRAMQRFETDLQARLAKGSRPAAGAGLPGDGGGGDTPQVLPTDDEMRDRLMGYGRNLVYFTLTKMEHTRNSEQLDTPLSLREYAERSWEETREYSRFPHDWEVGSGGKEAYAEHTAQGDRNFLLEGLIDSRLVPGNELFDLGDRMSTNIAEEDLNSIQAELQGNIVGLINHRMLPTTTVPNYENRLFAADKQWLDTWRTYFLQNPKLGVKITVSDEDWQKWMTEPIPVYTPEAGEPVLVPIAGETASHLTGSPRPAGEMSGNADEVGGDMENPEVIKQRVRMGTIEVAWKRTQDLFTSYAREAGRSNLRFMDWLREAHAKGEWEDVGDIHDAGILLWNSRIRQGELTVAGENLNTEDYKFLLGWLHEQTGIDREREDIPRLLVDRTLSEAELDSLGVPRQTNPDPRNSQREIHFPWEYLALQDEADLPWRDEIYKFTGEELERLEAGDEKDSGKPVVKVQEEALPPLPERKGFRLSLPGFLRRGQRPAAEIPQPRTREDYDRMHDQIGGISPDEIPESIRAQASNLKPAEPVAPATATPADSEGSGEERARLLEELKEITASLRSTSEDNPDRENVVTWLTGVLDQLGPDSWESPEAMDAWGRLVPGETDNVTRVLGEHLKRQSGK